MGLNIAVTGYFGAGSSAVLDLLCEYNCNSTGVKNEKGGYEKCLKLKISPKHF